jgi:hypothetical protein
MRVKSVSLPRLPLELPEAAERGLHALLEPLRRGSDPLPERLGQGLEFLLAERLATRRGYHRQTAVGPQHREPLAAGFGLQLLDGLGLATGERLQDPVALALEVFRLEGARQPDLALLHEARHLVAQLAAAPGG